MAQGVAPAGLALDPRWSAQPEREHWRGWGEGGRGGGGPRALSSMWCLTGLWQGLGVGGGERGVAGGAQGMMLLKQAPSVVTQTYAVASTDHACPLLHLKHRGRPGAPPHPPLHPHPHTPRPALPHTPQDEARELVAPSEPGPHNPAPSPGTLAAASGTSSASGGGASAGSAAPGSAEAPGAGGQGEGQGEHMELARRALGLLTQWCRFAVVTLGKHVSGLGCGQGSGEGGGLQGAAQQ
jgi:hypothetical protein